MLQLNSNDYGFHSQTLGFPSVMGCQAIVLLTSEGLYGLHDLKAGSSAAASMKVEFWGDWVRGTIKQKGGGAQMLKLYGVINNTQQYSDNAFGNGEWDQMLKDVAEALKFTGEICKYRVNKHIDKKGSIYIRFDVAHNDTCMIQYKRWSKMNSNDDDNPTFPNDYGFLRGHRGVSEDGTEIVTTHFTSQAPGILTTSVNRKGRTDEGMLHVVSARKIISVL